MQNCYWIISLTLFLSFAGVFFYAAILFHPLERKGKNRERIAKRVTGIVICAAVLVTNGWIAWAMAWGARYSDIEMIVLVGSSAVLLTASVFINVIKLGRSRRGAQG